jgi:Ca2+/Na+ antiporter
VSSLAALALLVAGVALVVAGADVFFRGLLALAARLGLPAFVVTVVLSGFELENLAAGIAANTKGLPGAAAGTFLGGTTFLAAGVAGLGALIAPMRARLPSTALVWTAAAPVPLLLLSLDGTLSRLDGGLLLLWFVLALAGLARSGRSLLAAEPVERRNRAFVLLVAGLAVLTLGASSSARASAGPCRASASPRPCWATRRSPPASRPRSSPASPSLRGGVARMSPSPTSSAPSSTSSPSTPP